MKSGKRVGAIGGGKDAIVIIASAVSMISISSNVSD